MHCKISGFYPLDAGSTHFPAPAVTTTNVIAKCPQMKPGVYAQEAGVSKSARKATDPELLLPQVCLFLCPEAADRGTAEQSRGDS